MFSVRLLAPRQSSQKEEEGEAPLACAWLPYELACTKEWTKGAKKHVMDIHSPHGTPTVRSLVDCDDSFLFSCGENVFWK